MDEVLNNILADIRSRGLTKGIARIPVTAYSMRIAKQWLMAVGGELCPGFALDNDNEWVYEQLIKWVQGDPTMEAIHPETRQKVKGDITKGLYIAGSTGTGKSVALEVMSAFTLIDNIKVTLGDNTRPLRWSCIRADVVCDEYASNGSIARFKHAPILAIQDFGSEPDEVLYMGNRLPVMRTLIEFRGDQNDNITLLSSNFPMSSPKLVKRYGERVVSRLGQMCNYYELRGKDRRK